jgi:hypothetical protein
VKNPQWFKGIKKRSERGEVRSEGEERAGWVSFEKDILYLYK